MSGSFTPHNKIIYKTSPLGNERSLLTFTYVMMKIKYSLKTFHDSRQHAQELGYVWFSNDFHVLPTFIIHNETLISTWEKGF